MGLRRLERADTYMKVRVPSKLSGCGDLPREDGAYLSAQQTVYTMVRAGKTLTCDATPYETYELLCLEMSTPCILPEGDQLDAVGLYCSSPLLLMEVDPVQMEIAKCSGVLGPFLRGKALRMMADSTQYHFFPNHKSDCGTSEWLMLRSDWDNLPPSTVALILMETPAPKLLKAVSSIKHAWKILLIKEALHSYIVELDVADNETKLSVTTVKGNTELYPTSNLQLQINSKAWEKPEVMDVSFSCNIDVSGVEITSKSHQKVSIYVPKHSLWNSGPALLPRLDFDPKTHKKLNTKTLQALLEGNHGLINKMFLAPNEQYIGTMRQIHDSLSARFRDQLRLFWEITGNEPQIGIIGLTVSGSDKLQLDIVIRDYYLRDEIPVMHVSYADLEQSNALVERGELSYLDMQLQRAKQTGLPLNRVTLELLVVQGTRASFCVQQQVLDLLQKLLLSNSFLMKQDSKNPPWIRNSFIQLYYPHFMRSVPNYMEELELMKKSSKKEEKLFAKSQQPCEVCGSKTNTRKCSRCEVTHYCSRTCQKADWPKHKKICKDFCKAVPTAQENSMSWAGKGFLSKPSKKDDKHAVLSPSSSRDKDLPKISKQSQDPKGQDKQPSKETVHPKPNAVAFEKSTYMRARSIGKEVRECKVCHKKSDDLEVRVVYYCSIGCHERDGGKSYPVDILGVSKDQERQQKVETAVQVKETNFELSSTKGGGESIEQYCDFCGRRSKTSESCSTCGQVYYCSAACRKGDYPQHKLVCKGNLIYT